MVNSQGLIQVVFNIGIPILGILIWVCPNLIIGKVKITKQCNSCFNFSVHIVDINLNKKKTIKLWLVIACIVYNIKTVIIFFKGAEMIWFEKRNFYITIRPLCTTCSISS